MRRPALTIAALAAGLTVAACDVVKVVDQETPATRRGTLALSDTNEFGRRAASRNGQLQTPLVRRPEETGAPRATLSGPRLDIDRQDLIAVDADISPRVRVWTRDARTGQGRILYGAEPGTVIYLGETIAVGECERIAECAAGTR
ncbi:MAG: hypothetical protein AAFR47_14335 [Pseudomonadota bacterium]